MTDHAAIFESDLLTFICGPDEKPVVIHSYAVISVSEVLKAMVTSGMKETNDKTAKLPEVSGRIFQLFSAWCYSGTYRVVAHTKKMEEPVHVSIDSGQEKKSQTRAGPAQDDDKVGYYCCRCGAHSNTTRSTAIPMCSRCFNRDIVFALGINNQSYCIRCGSRMDIRKIFCSACELLCRREDGPKVAIESAFKLAGAAKPLSDEFAKRMYPTEGMSHWETRHHLNRLQPPDNPTSMVSAHASLYILANMYKVEPLKALCLHKLHRDLMALDPSGETVQDVGRMLEFTYANTSDDDENGSGVGKDLRDLVVAYTSWKAGELVKLGVFRSMMSKGGEFVGEMVMPALCDREQ